MKHKEKLFGLLCFLLTILSAGILWFLDLPLDSSRTHLSYKGSSIGEYYPASSQGYALLIAEPEGPEKARLKPLIHLAGQADLPVLVLDLEETDLSLALEALSTTADVTEEDILLAAYGESSQSLLEELDGNSLDAAGVILLSPVANPDAFETGSLQLPTLILGTTSDDVATPESLASLYNRLTGDEILATGFGIKAQEEDISLRIVSGVFHSHSTYSQEITSALSLWLEDFYGIQMPASLFSSAIRPYLWTMVFLFWGLSLVFLYHYLSCHALEVSYSLLSVKGAPSSRYVLRKSLFWVIALIPAGILLLILWLLPLDVSLLSLAFLSWLSANAGLFFALYRLGKMPGVSMLSRPPLVPLGGKRISFSFLLCALTALWAYILARSGFWGWDFSFSHGVFFLLALPLCGLAVGVFTYESLVQEEFKIKLPVRIGLQVAQFLPLGAIGLFCIPINYWSGLLITLVGVAVLWISLLLGKVTQYLSGSLILSSAFGAIPLAAYLAFALV